MQNTNIEWTDHTINFWWGCTKVSPACQHCYAESVAKVFGKRLFGQVPQWGAGKPRFERLEAARKEALKIQRQAVKSGTRPRVFVNSMSDWLDDEVPLEWLAFLLETLILCPDVDFQLLTKRPQNWLKRVTAIYMECDGSIEYTNWLHEWTGQSGGCLETIAGQARSNLWLGTTVENQEQADKRIPALLRIPAKVRFLSCEPLLGPVDFAKTSAVIGKVIKTDKWGMSPIFSGLHWLIAGGESGGAARPTHPDWLRVLRDQCAAAGVAFFFKQWGEWLTVDQARHLTDESVRLDKGYKGHRFEDGTLMLRMGKDHTGRLLDGVLHDAFPANESHAEA